MSLRTDTTATSNRSVNSNSMTLRPGTSVNTTRKLRKSDISRNQAIELSQGKSYNRALSVAIRKKFENKINKHISTMYTSNKIPSLHPIRPTQVIGKIVPKIKGKDR